MSNSNERIKTLTLCATSVSYILVILDTSIVNVALPRIAVSLGVGMTALQWIVNAYIVVFASLLLSGGALGDRFGARNMYRLGLALFTVASLLCGISGTFWHLLLGRIAQGVGAAMLLPASLALITHAFEEGPSRAKAIATWASWGGGALALGPLAGGIIVQFFAWRGIFLTNVPICLIGLWMASRLPNDAQPNPERQFDLAGQLTAIVALIALVATLIELPVAGATSPIILAGFALFALSGLAFIAIEARASAPMLPLSMFRNANFSSISYIFFSGAISFFGTLFLLSFYFQELRHFTPLQTGLSLLPLSLFVIIGNKLSGMSTEYWPIRKVMVAGAVIRIIGFSWLFFINAQTPYWLIAMPLAIIGLGGGLGSPMSTSLFMSSVQRTFVGVASGFSRATGQMGSAIGVAVFGSLISDLSLFPSRMPLAILITIGLTATIIFLGVAVVREPVKA